jgi:hypothetical protein
VDSLYQAFKAKVSSKRTVVGDVDVPGVGKVYLCKMSAFDRDRCSAALLGLKAEDQGSYRARVVVAVACNADGLNLFTREDETWLSGLDCDVTEPIYDKFNQLNLAKDMTVDAEKNSGTAPNVASATA